MQSPDGMQAADNVHAGWRMAVAGQAARVYAGNRDLAAMAVAGSVGAGLADQFSDLELDCYWLRPPADEERLAPVRALGGELTDLWDYDPDDAEWSEDYLIGELGVTVSNFLVSTIGQFLDDVLLQSSTDPVRHMRLAAVQRSRPLLGAETMAAWRKRAGTFPRPLVSALVEQALAPEVLAGWPAREAFLDRGDSLALRDLMTRTGHAAVQAVLALNHVYLPHRQLKWQHQLTTGLRLAPSRFAERLKVMSDGPPGEALPAAETLLAETVALAGTHCDADLTDFRETLIERRRAIGPPPLVDTHRMAGDVVIRGDRLVLRALRPAEVDAEWQAMVAEAAGPRVSSFPPDEAAFLARLAQSGQLRDGWLDLAIDLDGTSIGRIQTFVPRGRALPPGTFDVGMGLREHARGQGYGREALTLLTDWLFEHAAAEVVEAGTDKANHAMRAVFRRAGWTEDGTETAEGHEWVRYRITRREWQALRP